MNKVERIIRSVENIKKERDDLRKSAAKLEKKLSSDISKNSEAMRRLGESLDALSKERREREKDMENLKSSMATVHSSITDILKEQRKLREDEMDFRGIHEDILKKIADLTEEKMKTNEKVLELKAASEEQKSMLDLFKARTSDVVNNHESRMNDISARVALKRILKDDLMSFAVPFRLFEEMERSVTGSFLDRETWKQLMALKQKP